MTSVKPATPAAPSPASPSTARALNDRLALRLLQEEGPLTAPQLKQLTGLSRPSVADLVERLAEAGLIEVVGESGEQRRGPNARLYGIVAGRAYLAALDVRTDSATAVVTDLLGRPLARAALPVDAVEEAVDRLEALSVEAGADRLHTVVIGAPGLVAPGSGELTGTAGLPAWHRDLVAALQRRLAPTVAVAVENETNLAALAEQRVGAARDLDSFVLLWLGAGVGAALVLDGRLRRGASGGAGEIGFLPVPGTAGLPSATDCAGGFHALAGRDAVAALAAAHGFTGPVEEAVAGAAGEAFLDALAERLSLGAAAVAAVLDPGCVVLAGELGRAGGAGLAARVARRLSTLSPVLTEVRASALGGAAVLEGARLAARESAQHTLFG